MPRLPRFRPAQFALTFLCLAALPGPLAASTVPNTVVSIVDGRWFINGERTYPGTPSEGLLLNVRMVNATFEDDRPPDVWPPALPRTFDPDANTRTFIARLPEYRDQGIRAITLSLQGGSPGYEGAHNSAFEADGSLRPACLERVRSVIAACDELNLVVILGCLYQRQHGEPPTRLPRALAGRDAIRAAVRNTALWLRDSGFRNVVLEVANEYAHSGYSRWRDGEWLRTPAAQVELINVARTVHPGLAVSTSGMGNGTIAPAVGEAVDFILVHLNNTSLDTIPARLGAVKSAHPKKPVVVNEDDKTGAAGARAAELSVAAGVSWGYMGTAVNQYAPFEYGGASDDPPVYATLAGLSGRAGPRLASGSLVSIVLTQPTDGMSFPTGAAIELLAAVTQPVDQPVRRVRFLADGQVLGTASAPPWRVVWNDAAAGQHTVTVEALTPTGRVIASATLDLAVGESLDIR